MKAQEPEKMSLRVIDIGDYVDPADGVRSLYSSIHGSSPEVSRIAGAGSDRIYFRLHAADSDGGVIESRGNECVGTWGEDTRENRSFIELSCVFGENDIPVPHIYAVSKDYSVYLQEDLGAADLLSLISGPRRMELARTCLRQLVRMQILDRRLWHPCVMMRDFSTRQAMWDLNYFKYEFLKPSGLLFDEDLLEDDFEKLSKNLTVIPDALCGFMYRDFQSRNVMVLNGEIRFIDYQGGRLGPCIYDAISFLWQAKAHFTAEERKVLLECYIDHFADAKGIGKDELWKYVPVFSLFRTLQVLGAYGFRGLVEKKSHFIESIPAALDNLRCLLEEGVLDGYPELEAVCRKAVGSRFSVSEDGDVLEVTVFSFSYKKGYPEDLSGNGGGFMFDCRGMHNPGRYDEYRHLTGYDKPVIDFLESKGEAGRFVEGCIALVAPCVDRYLKRGFRHLQVGFGCTGGQHRSVYCAEKMSRELKRIFPEARIVLVHREQGVRREIKE